MKPSPSLCWRLIIEKKKIEALFFLSLVQCQWCFSEWRPFRAAENFSLAYWIEFFWLFISQLLLLFAESFWWAGASFDSICQQFLFNYRKGERGGPGRFWGTQAHPNLHDRKKIKRNRTWWAWHKVSQQLSWQRGCLSIAEELRKGQHAFLGSRDIGNISLQPGIGEKWGFTELIRGELRFLIHSVG